MAQKRKASLIQPSEERLRLFGPFIALLSEDGYTKQTLRRMREAGVLDANNNLTRDWHAKATELYKNR